MRQENGSYLMWFFAGLGFGAVIGLVMAPARGYETRRLIGEKADDAREYLAGSGREYLDRGRELYERGRMLADEAAEMFDEGRRLIEGENA